MNVNFFKIFTTDNFSSLREVEGLVEVLIGVKLTARVCVKLPPLSTHSIRPSPELTVDLIT